MNIFKLFKYLNIVFKNQFLNYTSKNWLINYFANYANMPNPLNIINILCAVNSISYSHFF